MLRRRLLRLVPFVGLAAASACDTGAGGPTAIPAEEEAGAAPDRGTAGEGGASDAGAADDGSIASNAPVGPPDTFAPGDYDVETIIDTAKDRRAISPLVYGLNSFDVGSLPARLLASVSFVRRGGDRVNTYNWEKNLSTSSTEQPTQDSDYTLVSHLPLADRSKPAALDLDMIARTRAAGVRAMIPFCLHDYVASVESYSLGWRDWSEATGERDGFFRRVLPVRPSPAPAEPDANDGVVYSDEHFTYLRSKLGAGIYGPGPTQVLVATDNEPDIYAGNYPYLQAGSGASLVSPTTGKTIGHVVDGLEFANERFLPFVKRVKALVPNATIVGPSHYHYDGYTTWETRMPQFDDEDWFMESFLDLVRSESDSFGRRLLDIWDMHWYPQGKIDGELVEYAAPTTPARIDAIVQSPRAYWDHDYDERSWVSLHTGGPTYILERIKSRIDAHYPGTGLGVSEYFPGGCGHIASGVGVADSLGIFMRMGVTLAALWPDCTGGPTELRYAYGAIELLRNADGARLRFADTMVSVVHPGSDKPLSSVYAGSDGPGRLTVLVVNKSPAPRRFALRAFHGALLANVRTYRIDAANAEPTFVEREPLRKRNAYVYTAPALSAAMLVFETR